MNYLKKKLFRSIFIVFIFTLAACSANQESNSNEAAGGKDNKTFMFADAGFDSLSFHNEVAGFILENGFGYQTDKMPGSTPATIQGLGNGDIDIYMEVWTDNVIEHYQKVLDSGDAIQVGINYDDNAQGIYVPTYVIKGDPERGIEPMAPDLKSVEDLNQYWELFEDPEDAKKGRIVGAIPGWEVDQIVANKIESYDLDKNYNLFRPGSEAALSTSIVTAYEDGKPWVGYYWEPTWIMGKYDFTLLEEDPYTEEGWKAGTVAFPPMDLAIAVNKETYEAYPDVVQFLEKYQTSSKLVNEALAYMQENDASTKEAAVFFLKEHEDIWTEWLPEDIASKVQAAL